MAKPVFLWLNTNYSSFFKLFLRMKDLINVLLLFMSYGSDFPIDVRAFVSGHNDIIHALCRVLDSSEDPDNDDR